MRQVSFQALQTDTHYAFESNAQEVEAISFSFFFLLFLNQLTHQSIPGPHLYLCMHLLLQVAPLELRRHRQPNAIDKETTLFYDHSCDTIRR